MCVCVCELIGATAEYGGDGSFDDSIRLHPPRPTPQHHHPYNQTTPPHTQPPHNSTQFRFTPPSAVISGCLGLALYDIMGACSKLLQVELEASLRSIEVNMCVFFGGKGRVVVRVLVGFWWGSVWYTLSTPLFG